MAGEQIYPMSTAHRISVEVVLPADVTRGDYLRVGNLNGFALADRKKDDVVDVCVECKLVQMKAIGTAGGAGDRVVRNNNSIEFDTTQNFRTQNRYKILGYLHKAVTKTDTIMEVIWRNE